VSNEKQVFTARLNIIAATKELHDLAVGPKEGLRPLAWDVLYVYHAPIISHVVSRNGALERYVER
jgi:hypothetical protein